VPLAPETYLAWLDRDGRFTRLVDTPRLFRGPRLDPGGRRVAVAVGTAADSDLWLVDANATMSRLSFGLSPHQPAWTPDGKAIAVGAEQRGSWRLLAIPASGGGSPRVLLEGPHRMYPNAWSPDGRDLVFQEYNGQNGWDLQVLPVGPAGQASGPARPLAETPFHETRASLSPDGRWVAYESDELDSIVHVYVRSFPEGGRKVRVSMTGARSPCWGGRGELYYWDTTHSQFQVVRLQEEQGQLLVKSSQPWAAGGQKPPSASRVVVLAAGARFGVHPSGNRLLVLETSTPDLEPSTSRPVVVLGWADELQARMR
jgi:Tol biopolymer transport system component